MMTNDVPGMTSSFYIATSGTDFTVYTTVLGAAAIAHCESTLSHVKVKHNILKGKSIPPLHPGQ